MSTQHKDITEADLHETKGASTAASGTYLVADGVGSAQWKVKLTKYTVTISPTIVNANTTSEQTFTVSGIVAATDNIIAVTKPTHQAGLSIGNYRVTADNTIAIQFINNTGAGITPTASETYIVTAYRA